MSHVALPEGGEFARFTFSLSACSALQDTFGRTWRDDVFAGLAELQPDIVSAAIGVALVDGDAKAAPWGLPVQTVANRLSDALSLHLFGRTRAEQDIADDEALVAALARVRRTEQRIAALHAEGNTDA